MPLSKQSSPGFGSVTTAAAACKPDGSLRARIIVTVIVAAAVFVCQTFEDFAASLPQSERPPGHAFTYQSVNTQVLAEVLDRLKN